MNKIYGNLWQRPRVKRISWHGNQLEGGRTLFEYGIWAGDLLKIKMNADEMILDHGRAC